MPAKRVLLIEDEPIVHELLAHGLRDEGYVVDVAATVAEARRRLDARAYSAVVADWRLPDGDGTPIADAASELGAKTFVISGYLFSMPSDRRERHETLMKPVRIGELASTLERSIGKAVG
jgi:DNA-binding response OmpR family regulator